MNPIVFEVFQGNNVGSSYAGAVAAFDARLSLEGDAGTLVHGFSECTLRSWNGVDVGVRHASEALQRGLAVDGDSSA